MLGERVPLQKLIKPKTNEPLNDGGKSGRPNRPAPKEPSQARFGLLESSFTQLLRDNEGHYTLPGISCSPADDCFFVANRLALYTLGIFLCYTDCGDNRIIKTIQATNRNAMPNPSPLVQIDSFPMF